MERRREEQADGGDARSDAPRIGLTKRPRSELYFPIGMPLPENLAELIRRASDGAFPPKAED